MNEENKREILKFLAKYTDLKKSTSGQLRRDLKRYGFEVSVPTINRYKSRIIKKTHDYYSEIGLPPTSYDEIIEGIVDELSRNKKKIKENLNHRNRIRNELSKYKKFKISVENSKNIVNQNKDLKKLKKDICSKLNDIPPKTLNYLYNDEAKKVGLLSKRSTVSPELINKIENLFKDNVIQKYISEHIMEHISEKSGISKHIVKIVQDYIEENYKIKMSRSMINRYFYKNFKNLLDVYRGSRYG